MKRLCKRYLRFAAAATALTFSCAQYSSDFNRIDGNKLRVIGVSYLPRPDVAPGDTVTARVYFTGNKVVQVDKFSMAFNGYGDRDGTIFDEKPLAIIATESWLPDSFQYTFILPDSVFLKHRSWFLDSTASDSMARLMIRPKDSVVAFVTSLPQTEQSGLVDRIKKLSLGSVTFCTATAENGTSLRVLSNFSVRYNSRYREFFPVNNNPSISWIAAYTVPRSVAMSFDPFNLTAAGSAHKTYLFNAQYPDSVDTTVVIDTGYSYFFAADNGVRMRLDSAGKIISDTLSDIISMSDGPVRESYSYKWFFQNRDPVTDYLDSMLVIDDQASGPVIEFKPPMAVKMAHFKLWTAVFDQADNLNADWPRGMGVKAVSGIFRFTDAYKKEMGQ